jgi:hypothetical protein
MITYEEMQARMFAAENRGSDLERYLDEATEERNTWKARAEFSYQERSKLERQLAESQAREAELTSAVVKWCRFDSLNMSLNEFREFSNWFKARPTDDTALRQAIDAWRGPVIDELVSCGIYAAGHDSDPRKAIKDAIAWNVAVALDPAVSAQALELVDAARAEEKEACILDVVRLAGCNSPSLIADAIRARGKQ